jgi:hypothetical protein
VHKSSVHSKKRNKAHLVPIPPETVPGLFLCSRAIYSECYPIFALSSLFVLEYGCEPVPFSPAIGDQTRAIEFKNPAKSQDGHIFPTCCLGYALKICPKLDKLIINYTVFRQILSAQEPFAHNLHSIRWREFFSNFLSNPQCRFMVRDIYRGARLRDLTLPAALDLIDLDTDEHWKDVGQGDFVLTRAPRSEARLDSNDVLLLMRQVWATCVRLVNDIQDGFGKTVQVKGANVVITHRLHQNLFLDPRRTLAVCF